MKRILLILLLLPLFAEAQVITTIAGNGTGTNTGNGGLAVNAGFNLVNGVSFDNSGHLLICSGGSVRKLDSLTGIITLFAGDSLGGTALGDGGLAYYAYMRPIAACVDNIGNTYISDAGSGHPRIRKVDVSTGIITTIAGNGTSGYSGDGGPATNASISGGWICLDTSDNLYIGDTWNFRVRKVNLSTGIITTYAGTGVNGYSGDGGPATAAKLSQVDGVCIDHFGNIYFGDRSNGRIRKVDAVTSIITTFAGNGIIGYGGDGGNADTAKFYRISGMAIDSFGNIFFADQGNNRIRKINSASHIITTVAGNGPACPPPPGTGGCGTFGGDGGPADSGYIHTPQGVCLDHSGNLYIGDYNNYRVRKVGYGVLTPTFIGGAIQPLNICINATAVSINSLMSIVDPSVGLTDSWTIVSSPSHGTLSGFTATAISSGGIVTPTGLSYTPTTGYTGVDAFTIKVRNGQDSTITTINVNVNPLPAAITGISSLCVGVSATFSSSTTGGTWTSSSTSIAPIVYATGVATGMTAGTVIITYTTAPGCVDTAYLTVSPLPSSISGLNTVCAGANITLSDSVFGGTWSSSNANATIASSTGVVYGAAVGTSVISYVLSTGCFTTITVSVSTSPSAITGTTNVCAGLTTPLNSTPTGGFWYSSNWPVALVSGVGLVSTLSEGIATISYALGACMSVITLTVYSLPAIAGETSVCKGYTTLLSDGAPGGTWSSSNTSVASVSSTGVVRGLDVGTSEIAYTLGSGCNVTATITVNPCLAATLTVSGDDYISIYPNPATTSLNISASDRITSVAVTNILGQIIYSNECDSKKVQIDISNLAKGIYLVRINVSEIRRFVKE
jgi:uncharacterized protein YjdB